MKILVLGSGGRESALSWKLSQSVHAEKVYVAPGNAGTVQWAENADVDPMNFAQVKEFVLEKGIGMLVVGPEDPLVAGIHDYFLADPNFRDLAIIGPCRQGARLEGSKEYAKAFMERAGIPTAAYAVFGKEQIGQAKAFLKGLKPPYVLKADGLAAGKGVLIEPGYAQACASLEAMLEGKFGPASSRVVIEEYLEGIELSVFVLTDGKSYLILPEAKDYKKAGEGDTGPNTGGMGSVSPVPFARGEFMDKVEERIVKPTLARLQAERIPYTGFLFIGLMNVKGDPYVIEYNVRMGDPETESVFPRIESDLVELFQAVHAGRLHEEKLSISPLTAASVMLVSGGYPGSYKKGFPVETGSGEDGSLLFHAGTALDAEGRVLTAGGRVMAVTALGEDLESACARAYARVAQVAFEGMRFRKDIGKDLLGKGVCE